MVQSQGSLAQANVMSGAAKKSLHDLVCLRLVTGFTLLLVSLAGLLGADWDIQWHAVIGRDRTFTPPHDLILIGIALSGIVALISILVETNWLGRRSELRAYGVDFLGVLHSSAGSYLVGFGAVCSAVAFPLDTYWHSLYGIDVSLWAPFHTMIYMGGVLSTFGVIYHLLSAAHLAESQHDRRMATFSYAGVVVGLGMLFSKFSTFLTPALSGNTLHLSFVTVSLFPFLMAFAAVFVCVLAVRLLPWMGAATIVMVVFLLFWLLVWAFIPPMITLLVQAEHETFLARASRIGSTIVPLLGQTPALLLTALGIDGVVWLGRHRRWTLRVQKIWGLVVAMISMLLVAGFIMMPITSRLHAAQGGRAGGSVVLGIIISLALAIPGCLPGGWLALTMSETLQTLRR